MLKIIFLIYSAFLNVHGLEVVSWNIEKGKNSDWKFFLEDNPNVDYWGIQEALKAHNEDFISLLGLDSHFNSAWSSSTLNTGTLSASRTAQLNINKVVTNVYEPIVLTPKSFIVSDLESECGGEVRIVNTHMINFKLGKSYLNQLQQIDSFISDFKGALIVLGDFNNWNFFRTRTLKKWIKSHNLSTHREKNMIDNSSIDHIFFRGLKLINYKKAFVNLSDHEPIKASFGCL